MGKTSIPLSRQPSNMWALVLHPVMVDTLPAHIAVFVCSKHAYIWKAVSEPETRDALQAKL